MADNLNLAQILDGIATLTDRGDIKTVLEAVKEQKKTVAEKKKKRRTFTEEEKDALAQGNSQAMIIKNEEVFNYRLIPEKEIEAAKKRFNVPKPAADKTRPKLAHAYYMWRWNDKKFHGYKGFAIMEKATGQSASSSSAPCDGNPPWLAGA